MDDIKQAAAFHWGSDFEVSAFQEGPCFVVTLTPRAVEEAPPIDRPAVLEGRSLASFEDALHQLAGRVPPLRALARERSNTPSEPIRYVVRRPPRSRASAPSKA